VCSACPPGQYTTATGATACEVCGIGSFALNGISCVPCLRGSFNSMSGEGVTACETCDVGYYATAYGSTAPCISCSIGKYASGLGSSSCDGLDCAAGTYASRNACTDCPVGTFTPSIGATSCIVCGLGRYANETAATSCINCPSGSFSAYYGATSCADCPRFSYSVSEVSDSEVSDSGGTTCKCQSAYVCRRTHPRVTLSLQLADIGGLVLILAEVAKVPAAAIVIRHQV